MITIICAMEQELKEIINLMENIKYETFGIFKFFFGKINNTECVAVLCGVGKVNAAMCAQSLINKYRPEIILNVGVAGAIDKKIKVGDIVISDYAIEYDFDISAFPNRKKGEISGINTVSIPCCKETSDKILKSAKKHLKNTSVHVGTILTGDQFINSKEKLKELKDEFGGLACDMETGSIAQVCFLNKVKFVAVRSISDTADSNSHIDFYSFLEKSSKNAAIVIKEFIKSKQD